MFQKDNELKALAAAFTKRLKYSQPVIIHGFLDGVPSKLKLWDLESNVRDELDPEGRASLFRQHLTFLAEALQANQQQIEATEKAFDSPAGLSHVEGLARTGKTFTSMLQAFTAVSMGHKVILCASSAGAFDIQDFFRKHLSNLPHERKPKAYLAASPWWEGYQWKMVDLAEASHDPDSLIPTSLGHGVWKALKENLRLLETPEIKALLQQRERYHASLQPLLESKELLEMFPNIQGYPSKEDQERFLYLYNKLYFRVVKEADIIITSCHSAGVDEIVDHFRPTVAIVDQAHLATKPEALIPLLLYEDVRFRILLGDIKGPQPHQFPADGPSAAQRQLSLLEQWTSMGVPVFKMQHQYPEELQEVNGGQQVLIARGKPCPCGSKRKFKKCCGKDEE